MKRTISFILALLIAVSASATVLAVSEKTKTATLSYNNIKVTLDGKAIDLRGEKEPFIIDGTTYLPVRAIAEALGLDVSWDGNTNTVMLSSYSTTSTKNSTSSADSTSTTKSQFQQTTPDTATYILNKNTKKFHVPSCSSVKQIKESNKGSYDGSRDELIAKGYSPCGKCNP